ncbi:sensor histidine kinase [Fulvivirga lutea]|uniref:histidine kinase n=1 Tax=Fulvivirga lutea TaxID=2810512 RepID=A0A974WJ44_9BACT|nr:HAMP domain-containing sensor histidine kinase [Fulvivirga lutea]QSE97100.1 HAMP domain-containing histidine kinase [Fulvivirga lutea]
MSKFRAHLIPFLISLGCFLVSAACYFSYNHFVQPEEEVTSDINDQLNIEITKALNQLKSISDQQLDNEKLFKEIESNDGVFAYREGKIRAWSDFEYVPDYAEIKGNYEVKFIRSVRKEYLACKVVSDGYELVKVIPLYSNFKIENKYFNSSFKKSLFPTSAIRIVKTENADHKICYKEQCLFGIVYLTNSEVNRGWLRNIGMLLFITGSITFLIFTLAYCKDVARQSFFKALAVLLLSLFVFRYLLLELELPNGLSDSPLFDSKVFASSVINTSLADLILNLFIFLVFASFVWLRLLKSKDYRSLLRKTVFTKNLVSFFLISLFIFSFHWLFLLSQTLYHNSQISFDINQSILFDVPRMAAIICYILFGIAIFLIAHTAVSAAIHLGKSRTKLTLLFLVSSVVYSLANELIDQAYLISVLIAAMVFFTVLLSRIRFSLTRLSFSTFLYLFLFMGGFALVGSGSIYEFENEREVERKKRYVSQFLTDNDHMAEYLLYVANEKIANDIFIQTRMASPFLSKDVVKSKIKQVYLNDYFDKYDVRIFTYDAEGRSFESELGQPQNMKKLTMSEFKTGYDDIYFINLQESGASKRYLNYIEVKRRGIQVGFIVLDLRLKRIIPDNVFPEMLVDNRFLTPYQNADYSYAVFNDDEVAYSSGDFNYDEDFIERSNFQNEEKFSFDDYSHVAVNDQAGHRIVVSSNDHPLADVVSNFSFFFLLQVFLLLLCLLAYVLIIWIKKLDLSYSARIQLYLNIAFFLPLIAVSLTTLSLINASFEREVVEEYYKKAEQIGSSLSSVLSDFVENITNEDELNETIADISAYAGADINLFSTSGKLIASNQPSIYENELLSEFVNPEAYSHIVIDGEKAYTTKESVGELKYNSVYFGVKSYETGDLVGVVSIPFFDSESALQESQIVVLKNIINVFTFVFIAFLIVSYFATEWLTFPLRFITQKLKRTTLTEFNEPLNWESNDEIGLMVGEYNKMLINLEESKNALARSEKQSAWREIAQQVAHEIKNPLTPMKLTLQHLQRTLDPSNKERSKPINSLLKQIETLDDIATSFSSFAKMPIPASEKFELTSVINNNVSIHKATKNLIIDLQLPNEKVYTLGDEQLMGRIISNLILNGIQSSDKAEKELQIALKSNNQKILLSVTDNGAGIPEEIQSKIFVPNFTTKESGSGIGLAIAKHGIEHAGGKIWFETEEGKGTTFYIELPLLDE